jgi:hypothetical protein
MQRNSTFLIGVILLATVMLAGHAAAQDCVEPPAGLVSWWPGDGNADDIQGSNDGTLVSGVGFAPGMVGDAFVINGAGSYVLIGNPANLQLQDFTIDAWVKPNRLDLTNNTILLYGPGGYGFQFCRSTASCGNAPAGSLLLTEVGFSQVGSATSFPDTDWHHVAVTKDGSTVVFYLDGVAFPGLMPYDPGFTFTSNLAIGNRADSPTQPFPGLIDETEVFDRALSASEIRAIFDAGSAGKCKPPPPPTPEELLQRIEDLEAAVDELSDHTHTYRTGRGRGHNNTEAETELPETPLE